MFYPRIVLLLCSLLLSACTTSEQQECDVILRNGIVYDGSGSDPYAGDVAIRGDKIVAIGARSDLSCGQEIIVDGLAIAPGFINMMSWANETLIEDGRSLSDIRQGVTLEVMGEGRSMGPLNASMKEDMVRYQGDIKFAVEWTTLGEYLEFLEQKGVSTNVASFIGAATPRIHVIGYEDRPPTEEEMERMKALVRTAMEEGAMGVASSLIYPPGIFAETEELVGLAEVAAEYDGLYASHMRSEGAQVLQALDELLAVARGAAIRSEIYHLKVSGRSHWHLFDDLVARIEAARAEGLPVTADVYTYPAGSTGLTSIMPPWVQEGGNEATFERLRDTELRQRIAAEMLVESDEWENMYLGAGSPDNILLVGFRTERLKPLTGMTLAEVAEMRGTPAPETAMDLIVEDSSRVNTVYFTQSEENLRKKIALPWVSFCSDAASLAPEGIFLESSTHPRAYGSFARLLGKYVREERLITLQEAVRKLAGLPAANLKLDRRGLLEEGFFADVVVFDPETIQDHATFEEPHQPATGVKHVFVNGVQVLEDGEHTGALPGRFVRGPGWAGRR